MGLKVPMAKGIREFLRLVWAEWSSRVTGSLSALLVLLGLGISITSAFGIKIPSEGIIQLATWLLAAICGGQAAFSVWTNERKEVVKLQTRLEPKLRGSFSMDDPLCKRADVQLVGGLRGDWYRVRVESVNDATIPQCSVRLLDIFKGENAILSGETPRLAISQQSDPLNTTILPGIPYLIDLLVVRADNQALLASPTTDGVASIDFENLFSESGDYTLRIAVGAPNIVTLICKLLFIWQHDRTTAKLRWLA
jgi:hypothetical protein